MKKLYPLLLAGALSLCILHPQTLRAAELEAFQVAEFATIRWDGRENSQVIRPNGKVESLRPLFERYARPERTDERIYYVTLAMNALAKEGYEFAGAINEHVVMRRMIKPL